MATVIPKNHEEAYKMLQDALNYFESVGEEVTFASDTKIVGETSNVTYISEKGRWETKIHMGLGIPDESIRALEKPGAEAELMKRIFGPNTE